MNKFKADDEFEFEPVPEPNGDEPFDWWNKNPQWEEICRAHTHYLDELHKLPFGHGLCRPHFERTQWWTEEVQVGVVPAMHGEDEDADMRPTVLIKLFTHPGILDHTGNDGLLAVYRFTENKKMKVEWSRIRLYLEAAKSKASAQECPHGRISCWECSDKP